MDLRGLCTRCFAKLEKPGRGYAAATATSTPRPQASSFLQLCTKMLQFSPILSFLTCPLVSYAAGQRGSVESNPETQQSRKPQ